jgi:hypothetical protein
MMEEDDSDILHSSRDLKRKLRKQKEKQNKHHNQDSVRSMHEDEETKGFKTHKKHSSKAKLQGAPAFYDNNASVLWS